MESKKVVGFGVYLVESVNLSSNNIKDANWFKAVFDNSVYGYIVADAETKKFRLVNQTMSRMLGYSPDELKNMSVSDIHPKSQLNNIYERFEKLTKGLITEAKDLPVLRKNGTIFYVDITSCPLKVDGKTYLLGTFRDVSERKQNKDKLNKQLDFQNSLYRMYSHATVGTALDPFMDYVLEEIGTSFGVSMASFFTLDAENQEIVRAHTWRTKDVPRFRFKSMSYEGLCDKSQCNLTDKAILKANVSDKNLPPFLALVLERVSAKSMLGVPLCYKNTVPGYICVFDCVNERQWDNEDETFMKSVSETVRLTLENRAVQERMVERLRIENIIAQIALNTMSDTSFSKKMDSVLDSLGKALNAHRAHILQIGPDGKSWADINTWVSDGGSSFKAGLLKGDDFNTWIKQLKHQGLVAVSDASKLSKTDQVSSFAAATGSNALFAVPVYSKGNLWGAIGIGFPKRRELVEEDITLLSTVAIMVGWLAGQHHPKLN